LSTSISSATRPSLDQREEGIERTAAQLDPTIIDKEFATMRIDLEATELHYRGPVRQPIHGQRVYRA